MEFAANGKDILNPNDEGNINNDVIIQVAPQPKKPTKEPRKKRIHWISWILNLKKMTIPRQRI